MTKVQRESLSDKLDEHRARFDALLAEGKVSADVAVLFEGMFTMLQMLEKYTRKTSGNTSLPASLTPLDKTAKTRKGSKGKGL